MRIVTDQNASTSLVAAVAGTTQNQKPALVRVGKRVEVEVKEPIGSYSSRDSMSRRRGSAEKLDLRTTYKESSKLRGVLPLIPSCCLTRLTCTCVCVGGVIFVLCSVFYAALLSRVTTIATADQFVRGAYFEILSFTDHQRCQRSPSWKVAPDMMRCLPNVFFIGASKCGTSSMRSHLFSHPHIRFVRRMQSGVEGAEIHRFDRKNYGAFFVGSC